MGRFYVDITGVPREFLAFMGYETSYEDDDFMLLICKGEEYLIPKDGRQHIYVDDENDARAFKARPRIPAPPRS